MKVGQLFQKFDRIAQSSGTNLAMSKPANLEPTSTILTKTPTSPDISRSDIPLDLSIASFETPDITIRKEDDEPKAEEESAPFQYGFESSKLATTHETKYNDIVQKLSEQDPNLFSVNDSGEVTIEGVKIAGSNIQSLLRNLFVKTSMKSLVGIDKFYRLLKSIGISSKSFANQIAIENFDRKLPSEQKRVRTKKISGKGFGLTKSYANSKVLFIYK
jgi:hypothetical protein